MWSPLVRECLPCAPPPQVVPGPWEPLPQPEKVLVPARDGLAPDQVRIVQAQLDAIARDGLAATRFVVLPPGARVLGLADRLTIRLPAEMANPDYTRVMRAVSGEWREPFPGLQVRVRDPGITQADLDFRPAPEG